MNNKYSSVFLNGSYYVRYSKEPSENTDLMSWYFKCQHPTLDTCVMKAYDDLKRNLHGIGCMGKKEKYDFKKSVLDLINERLSLVNNVSSQDAFDEWHRTTCRSIIDIANNNGVNTYLKDGVSFIYGIAQKWLNMTIKYLIVTGLEQTYPLPVEFLHIPIDSYIYKAYAKVYKETEKKNKYALLDDKAPVIHSDDNKATSHSVYVENGDNRTQPWSKLNECDYTDLQIAIRSAVKNKYSSPIAWEGPAWIEQAKIEKEKRKNKRK